LLKGIISIESALQHKRVLSEVLENVMQTVALERVRIRKVLDFLSRNYSRVYRKEWREGNKILAIFIHQEYVLRTSSDQTLVTIVEYNQSNERGLCTVVASGGGKGLFGFDWGSGTDGERTVSSKVENLIRTDEMRSRLYCHNCNNWQDYEVSRGQTEVICRTCGQKIKVQ
jgi:ribosomal protein S27E